MSSSLRSPLLSALPSSPPLFPPPALLLVGVLGAAGCTLKPVDLAVSDGGLSPASFDTGRPDAVGVADGGRDAGGGMGDAGVGLDAAPGADLDAATVDAPIATDAEIAPDVAVVADGPLVLVPDVAALTDVAPPPDAGPPADTGDPLDLDPALVAHWKLDEGPDLGFVLDASTNGNHGNFLPGSPLRYVEGRHGMSLEVRTQRAAVIVNESPSIDSISNALTISAWVRPTTTGSGYRTILSRQSGTGGEDLFWVGLAPQDDRRNPDLDTLAFNSGAFNLIRAQNAVGRGVWTHVAVTYDGRVVRLFVKGQQAGQTNRSNLKLGPGSSLKNDVVVIGGNQNDEIGYPDEIVDSAVDDVRLYSRALTPTEIAALAR